MKLVLWEIWSYLQVGVVYYAFKRFAKRNVVGDLIAGSIIGVMMEFITEPLWDYHFKITYYKDTPVSVPLSWGVMFTLVTFVSEKLYCKVLGKNEIRPYDKRIFIFDLVAGLMVGLPMEMVGLKSGIWNYRSDFLNWTWGQVPFIHMPYEALVGYSLLMLIGPTFVRYWQSSFERRNV